VQTNNPALVNSNPYTISLTVTLTDIKSKLYDGVGNNKDWTKSNLSISIWVADPCKTTSLKKVNSTGSTDPGLGALTVVNGSSLVTDFTKALDTVEIAQGLDTLCGSRVY